MRIGGATHWTDAAKVRVDPLSLYTASAPRQPSRDALHRYCLACAQIAELSVVAPTIIRPSFARLASFAFCRPTLGVGVAGSWQRAWQRTDGDIGGHQDRCAAPVWVLHA